VAKAIISRREILYKSMWGAVSANCLGVLRLTSYNGAVGFAPDLSFPFIEAA
jgi:hypothetical protein